MADKKYNIEIVTPSGTGVYFHEYLGFDKEKQTQMKKECLDILRDSSGLAEAAKRIADTCTTDNEFAMQMVNMGQAISETERMSKDPLYMLQVLAGIK